MDWATTDWRSTKPIFDSAGNGGRTGAGVGVGVGLAAGGVCGGGVCVVGGVWAIALPATRTAKRARVIVCLLMSGLYLHLSKGNDNVERAAEASPSTLEVMRRVPYSRTFLTRSALRGLAAILLLAGATACDDPGPTTPTDPEPEPTTFTETFTGVLNQNGAVTFPFSVTVAGTATATLASVQPDNTVSLGFAMGTWNGTSCQSVISNDNAVEFTQIVGTVGAAGSLCLRVYDIGRVATTARFTVYVIHP